MPGYPASVAFLTTLDIEVLGEGPGAFGAILVSAAGRRLLSRRDGAVPSSRGVFPAAVGAAGPAGATRAFRNYGQLTCVHVPQQALNTQQLLVCGPASQSSQFSMISL